MQEQLEVHVGTDTPARWDERERAQAARDLAALDLGQTRDVRPRIATEDIVWSDLGLVPRWVGDDPSSAVAAIEASQLHGQGGEEAQRFQAGAAARSELALYVSTAGPSASTHPVFDRSVSVYFPYLDLDSFCIAGEPIRLARDPELGQGLSATDKDLALRIRNERALDREWVAFKPAAYQSYNGSGQRREGHFHGTWTPLLLSPDGHAVAGVWSDDGSLPSPVRHYVLPDMPSYRPVLQWLAERAVPDLVPTAAARTRSDVDLQPDLQTGRERRLADALAALRAQFEAQSAALEDELDQARADASPVRHGMLFGTGHVLEAVVAQVLADAGLSVEQLDEALGTVSGDLLVQYRGQRVLVEVKSSGGNAQERLVDALRRHEQTWPELREHQPLTGLALVVNHQHKQPPANRWPTVYRRSAFVDSLEYPVVSTLELFDAWCREDWGSIRAAIGLGAPRAVAPVQGAESPRETRSGRLPWWKRGRKSR